MRQIPVFLVQALNLFRKILSLLSYNPMPNIGHITIKTV